MNIDSIFQENNLSEARILSASDEIKIPETWSFLLTEENKDKKKALVIERWSDFSTLLPKTLNILEELLEDVFLVVHQQQIKMVYLLLVDEEYVLYVGNMPTTDSHIAILPDKLQHFYKHLHNGWFENISGGLGLLPIEKVRFLSQSEWGLPQEILQSTDLNQTYYVLHNGGNGYLCINIEDKENPKALIWWTNDAPKMDIDFWDYLDSWIEIGISY
ncbi:MULTISPECIES: SMI1/KNR4 family protein [Prevotella]|uniref:SMI1/KNR4 family protein n=1 Tax=Prevotella TaxID=838 RepID=UPI001CAC56A8|nr:MULTISPECIES: SMI1/KNR4 family protein [Prevotella]MBF1483187.1 SMI1/KNR4 family protein [Prevotella pallens]MBF1515092.1 SMI1/KNR4 family protein [Prevotella pallens]